MTRALLGQLTFFALTGASCAHFPAYDFSHEADPRKQEYVIGVSDGLRISVWKNPEMSAEVHVRPDGTITLPLLGDVVAAGRTPGRLKEELRTRLAAFIKDEGAIITVAVVDAASYRFSVSGNVEHPGMFTPKYFVTVTEALALAGGPSRFAGRAITIVRTDGDGKVRRIPIDSRRIQTGEHPEENLALWSGDLLVQE